MIFSPQQIKFEFLTYIKEFDVDPQAWRIGVAEDPTHALFVDNAVDESGGVWLWKPALSAAAAGMVLRFFNDRFGIPLAEHPPSSAARSVFLYKVDQGRSLHRREGRLVACFDDEQSSLVSSGRPCRRAY